ncbi:MAG TPA: hypothetical protein VGQ82_08095 [Chthoniobacterales bacterium]|nr:hypothetical protein [Chthoniobacterales bacterium]
MPAAALRALLAHSIDYAGLFPPADLALQPALRNHAQHVRTSEAWMLGAFILPITKFQEAFSGLSQFNAQHPLRVSALGSKTAGASEFAEALETAQKAIAESNGRHQPVASITQLEMPLPAEMQASVFDSIATLSHGSQLATFWEAPAAAAEETIALIAQNNKARGLAAAGFKLRTGGVIASAFPSSTEIARALVAAAKHRVPIKFTAGLHHPVRQFHPSVQTKMHGFLNVLGAGVLAAEHDWDVSQAATMLQDERAESFSFDDHSFRWREWVISTPQIKARRTLVTSLGSCSFDEPREDLQALVLM